MGVVSPSLASEDDIRTYTSAESHTLAVAFHRRFGWRLLVVTDSHDPVWSDPEDENRSVPSVVHVYAVDGNGDAWDIRGKRPRTEVRNEMYELFLVQDFCEEECDDEDGLAFFVGVWSDSGPPVERPLPVYSEEDVLRAEAVIVKAYPSVPVALIEEDGAQPRFPR